MTLFPVRRPDLGLSVSAGALGFVEVRRGWRGRRFCRIQERELPQGLVRPSPQGPNVSDLGALEREIRAVVGKSRSPLSVALALPDACARVVLFEFETLPARPAEREALVRWRFQQDLHVSTAEARMAFRVFCPTRVSNGEQDRATRVLAVAIQRDIVVQYEQVCEAAGLLPVAVGLTSLALFDLYRPPIQTTLRAMARKRQVDRTGVNEWFFSHVVDETMTFVAIRYGRPVFLRMKAVRHRLDLAHELASTVHYYDERVQTDSPAPTVIPRPLFILPGNGWGGDGVPLQREQVELVTPELPGLRAPLLDPVIVGALRIAPIPLVQDTLPLPGLRTDSPFPPSALPALASALAT